MFSVIKPRLALALGVLAAALSSPVSAQSASPGWMFAIIGGPGVTTPTPFLFNSKDTVYRTRKRPMVFELEISKTLRRSSGKNAYYEYFVASQPMMSVGGNVRYSFPPCMRPACRDLGVDIVEQRYTAYGVGISPIGLRTVVKLPFASRFAVAGQAGGVYLSRAIPYPIATRFNFHFGARPELTIPIGHLGLLTGGYEFFHVSNGNTGKVNPGINGGIYMVGIQR
jgi:hypothetical protein